MSLIMEAALQEINQIDVDMASLDLASDKKKRNSSGVLKTQSNINHLTPIESSDEEADCETEEEAEVKLRRSSRKKFRPAETVNRRVVTKPKKLGSHNVNIENYYLSKKVKRLPSTLETIFEEPKDEHNSKLYMSIRKFKRILNFDDINTVTNRQKTKRRQMKAKKLTAGKRINTKRKISIDLLKEKLKVLEDCD